MNVRDLADPALAVNDRPGVRAPLCHCVHCTLGMPSMCMAKALRHKTQTVAIILRSPADASILEEAAAAQGLHFYEVRPSVFTLEPIPPYLRRVLS